MSKFWTWLAQRRKFIVAEVTGAVGWSQMAWVPDGVIDRNEWYALAVVLLGGLGVHAVSNAPVESAVSLIRRAMGRVEAEDLVKKLEPSPSLTVNLGQRIGVGRTDSQTLVPVSPPPSETVAPVQ